MSPLLCGGTRVELDGRSRKNSSDRRYNSRSIAFGYVLFLEFDLDELTLASLELTNKNVSFVDWINKMTAMVSNYKFVPRIISRELVSMLGLFNERDMGDFINAQGRPMNISKVLRWLTPAYMRYREIIDPEVDDCEKTYGCTAKGKWNQDFVGGRKNSTATFLHGISFRK